MTDIPKKKAFGTCAFSHTSPPREKLSPTTQVLNITVGYEDALKLHMALQAALIQCSRYNFSTKKGKRAALLFAVHLGKGRLSLGVGSTKQK